MKTTFAAGIILGIGAFALSAPPAAASYMASCNKLFAEYGSCTSNESTDCSALKKEIENTCKCHEFQNGTWDYVVSAVGDDGVCKNRLGPPIKLPPPPVHPKLIKGRGH